MKQTATLSAPLFGQVEETYASGSSTQSFKTSLEGARDAQARAGNQCGRLLAAYLRFGPLTDAEAAKHLGIERTSVNARRKTLIQQGLVDPEPKGTRTNPRSQTRNATWGLVDR